MVSTTYHVDDSRRASLLKDREAIYALAVTNQAACDKAILGVAGGGLAVTATVVGMMLSRGMDLSRVLIGTASGGFAVATLVVILSHRMAARACVAVCNEIDLELTGKIRTARSGRHRWGVEMANRVAGVAVAVGVVGLLLLLAAAAANPPNPDVPGEKWGSPPHELVPKPAPTPKPASQPKPAGG